MTTSFVSIIGFLAMLQVAGAPAGGTTGMAGAGSTSPTASASSSGSAEAPATVAPAAPTVAGQLPAGKVITLTLGDVVNYAVNTNTNVVLARQRLMEAGEGVNQINAQGKPQLTSNIADTYSSYSESTAAYGPVVANPVVPTGTTIPTVTDDAADFSSAFGVGTSASGGTTFAAGYGAPLGGTGTSTTLSATNATVPGGGSSTSLPGLNPGTSTTGGGAATAPVTATPGGAFAPAASGSTGLGSSTAGSTPGNTGSSAPTLEQGGGSITTTPGTSAAPTGVGGTTGPGGAASPGMGTTGATGTSFDLMPMPLIIQNYVTESSAPQVVADTVSPSSTPVASAQSASVRSTSSSAADAKSASATVADQGTTTNTSVVNQVVGNRTVNNYGARVNLSQFIDAFGLLNAARDVEKLTTNFYALDVDRTQNEVALSAKNLYFNVILAQQQVATEQEQVNDSKESVRVTAALVQQGQAAGFDLLSAQTTLANNQQLLTSAQNQLSFAVANLDYLLGINPDTPISLVPPALPTLNQPIDLAQSTDVALQRRPEVIQANQNVTIAQKLVKVATEGTTPAIGLVGTYGYNSTSSVTGPENEGLVSAQVAVPLSDGGATRARVRDAKDILSGQVTTRDELKLSVALEVRQAYLNILTAQTQAQTAQAGVDLAVETLRVANVQYQNGVGTILDVENAQAQLATARTNLANAQYSYQTALASLTRDIGSR